MGNMRQVIQMLTTLTAQFRRTYSYYSQLVHVADCMRYIKGGGGGLQRQANTSYTLS